MIGMVLAAGTGRRLRPDTDGLPKAMLPVAGETTILDIALRNLAAAGLTEVVIVVGYAAAVVADRVPAFERAYGITIELVHLSGRSLGQAMIPPIPDASCDRAAKRRRTRGS